MLGDLYAERSHLTGNTRLRFYMSIKKYLIFKFYSIFKSYVKTEPKIFKRKKLNKLTNTLHVDIWFSTLKYEIFNWVIEDFYIKSGEKNIKIVHSYKNLTEISLAYWIMDDGSFNKIKGQLILCTDSYSKEDVLFLISILTKKFDLSCGLINYKKRKNGKNSYRIRINKSSMANLIKLVKHHIIPSMHYNLGI
jgi:LAGLIDADG DNA endonuclease family